MRKTLAILTAVLLVVSLLATSALAQGGAKQNNGSGYSKNPNAGKSTQQTPGRGQNSAKQELDEQEAEDTSSETSDPQEGDEDADDQTGDDSQQPGGKHGNKPEKTDDKPDRLNTGRIAEAISQLTDAQTAAQLTTLLNAYKTAAAGEDEATTEAARKALLDALAAAGISLKVKGEHTPAGGVLINMQAVTEAIGKLTDTETAAKLNELLAAYQTSAAGDDGEAAKAALKALLDALQTTGLQSSPDGTKPPHGNNIDVLREKILSGSNHGKGTLLALLHAYENAFRFRFEQPQEDTDTDTETDTGAETGTDTGAGTGTEGDGSLTQAAQELLMALDSAN